jgi:hypothetical protein
MSALKGNALAQRAYVQTVSNAKAQKDKLKNQELLAACDMKMRLEDMRDLWLASGRRERDMILHPDDVQIDPATGDVKYYLALTPEAQSARTKLLRYREGLFEVVARGVTAILEDGDDAFLQLGTEMAERQISRINEALPSRLRQDAAPIIPSARPAHLLNISGVG